MNHIFKFGEKNLFAPSIVAELIRDLFVFLLTIGIARIFSELINQAVSADIEKTFLLAGITVVILIISFPALFFINKWVEKKQYTTKQQYRESLYPHIITGGLPIATEGELAVKLNRDVDMVTSYLFTTLPRGISAVFVLIAVFVMACLYNPLIAMLFVAISLLQIIPTLFYENWARKAYKEVRADEEAYKSWLVEGFKGLQTIKAYERESWFVKRFSFLNRQVFLSGIKAEKVSTWETVIKETIGVFITYGNYLIVGIFAFMQKIDFQAIPLLIVFGEYIFSSVASLYEMRVTHIEYKEAYERLIIEEKEHSFTDNENTLLEARHIVKTFEEKKVLEDVSLSVDKSTRSLFMGDNGSGKTTLFSILSSFSFADEGVVLRKRDLRMSYVSQEEATLPCTVMEVSKALIRQGTIGESGFLEHLNGFGLGTEILEHAFTELSEGQKKKVFLSFALARDAELLILDEPTNHLDLDSIDYLLKLLIGFQGALMVSSHDSRIKNMEWDRVYTVNGGKVYA